MNSDSSNVVRIAAICLAGTSLFAVSKMTDAQSPAVVAADAAMCAACHGLRGEGNSSGAPRLAGQNTDYMVHALSLFKTGARKSATMQPVAAGLSDGQMRALAFHFSRQAASVPKADVAFSPALVPAGKQLAETGAANLAPCFSCHGAKGLGTGARFPGIAGQPAQFVLDRLHEFQARARNAVPRPGTMTAVAATMSESQVQAAAAYLAQAGGR